MHIIEDYIDSLIKSQVISFVANTKRISFNQQLKNFESVANQITSREYIRDAKYFENDDAYSLYKKDKSFRVRAIKYLSDLFEDFKKENSQPSKFEEFASSNTLTPFVDAHTADVVLWDNSEAKIAEMSYRTFKLVYGPKVISAMQEAGHFKPAWLTYDPIDMTPHQKAVIDGIETFKLNTYKPPEWRLKEVNPYLPPEFDSFFKFLFPVEKERSIIFTFLKHMILFRVSHILVLIGRKGIGKNILVEEILKPLVGRKYFAKPAKNFFKGAFQDVLEDNRLLFIDEIKATTDEAKKDLKRLPNAWQGIEKKKQDTKQQKIFYSVVIANNALDDIYIEYDDRRFFFPELTEARLKDIGQEVIDKYLEAFRDPENIAAFGNYLIQREDDPDFNEENAYITDTFHRAVEASLREWQAFIVKSILEAKTLYLDWKDLKKKNIKENGKDADKYFKPRRVQEFLDNYLHGGKHPLGDWITVEGQQKIKVNTNIVDISEESQATDVDTLIDNL